MMLQARALAECGFGTLILDLFGTGDSEGEFVQGRWDIWLGDLLAGADWLEPRAGPVAVLGLRWGALLATELVRALGQRAAHLVLWQPVVDGRRYMDQFLRLRVAASAMGPDAGVTVTELRQALEDGETLEVAGYELHPELVRATDERNLKTLRPDRGCVVDWIEVNRGPDGGLGNGSQRAIANWRDNGVSVREATVVDTAIWSTVETTTAPALIGRTTGLLLESRERPRQRPIATGAPR